MEKCGLQFKFRVFRNEFVEILQTRRNQIRIREIIPIATTIAILNPKNFSINDGKHLKPTIKAARIRD